MFVDFLNANINDSYLCEIGDGNFKGVLWTFKQWLAVKMRVHYGISIVLRFTCSNKVFSRYGREGH